MCVYLCVCFSHVELLNAAPGGQLWEGPSKGRYIMPAADKPGTPSFGLPKIIGFKGKIMK